MGTQTIELRGGRVLERRLVRIARRIPELGAKALNRTAFEMREAEAEHVKDIFKFAGPSTEKFLADRGFVFRGARPGKLSVELSPRPKTGEILEEHFEGASFTAAEGERLSFGGQLAIPVGVRRGRSGRVPKRLLPSQLIRSGKGFVNRKGNAILQRVGRSVRVAYILVPRARVEPTFRFFEVAFDRAREELPRKIRSELAKLDRG